MANKRQREARKKFKAANPELFPPKPEPEPNPNKMKKKKISKKSFKRKIADSKASKDPNELRKQKFTKRPLRVPGMKPGDSCFICKSKDHIAKFCPEKAQWDKHKICLFCRNRGHGMKNCPEKRDESEIKKLCYNCGESGHSLSHCPQPLQDGGTKFAKCFICNETGHLSKDCPQNAHGIYPKGGCCKICGGVTHLARDCPDKGKRDSFSACNAVAFGNNEVKPRGQVTKFVSGDDIEDDFMTVETYDGKKEKYTEAKLGSASHSQESQIKSKKKQGPKVVNFDG